MPKKVNPNSSKKMNDTVIGIEGKTWRASDMLYDDLRDRATSIKLEEANNILIARWGKEYYLVKRLKVLSIVPRTTGLVACFIASLCSRSCSNWSNRWESSQLSPVEYQ